MQLSGTSVVRRRRRHRYRAGHLLFHYQSVCPGQSAQSSPGTRSCAHKFVMLKYPGGDKMRDFEKFCSIAVVQSAPVMFDAAACTEKAARLIDEALRTRKTDSVPRIVHTGLSLRAELRLFRGTPRRGRASGLGSLRRQLHTRPRPETALLCSRRRPTACG